MIKVVSTDIDIGYFTDVFLKLYTGCSEKQLPKVWHSERTLLGFKALPATIRPYLNTVYSAINKQFDTGQLFTVENEALKVPKFTLAPASTARMLVGFSGGKDSVAVALWAREQGYEVTLYHLEGVNKSYPNEVDYAISLANEMGMPIIVRKIQTAGTSDYMDNPVKNQLILACMVEYGIKNDIANYALGDFYNDTLSTSNALCNLSDAKEMWDNAEIFFKASMPQFKYHHIFSNYTQSIIQILKSDRGLINKVMGCVSPLRYRANYKKQNEQKFNIQLLDGRCGSCWKCCAEYIIMYDLGVLGTASASEAFYKKCVAYLRGVMHREKPFIPNPQALSDEQVVALFSHRADIEQYRASNAGAN